MKILTYKFPELSNCFVVKIFYSWIDISIILLGAIIVLLSCSSICGQDSLYSHKDTVDIESTLDTLYNKVYYFQLSDYENKRPYKFKVDTFTFDYDPARTTLIDYYHLGNQGSAAVSNQFSFDPKIGFDAGFYQYELYRYTINNFTFLESNKPYLNVGFSPMNSADNFAVRTEFTRTFADGITLSSTYRRIIQQGIYQQQGTRLTNLNMSFRIRGKNNRYTGFLIYISNVSDEENNGGIRTKEQLSTFGIGNRSFIDVNLDNANTRHQEKKYALISYYNLKTVKSKSLSIKHQISLNNKYYKYSDINTSTNSDSIYYGQYNRDPRGLRRYTRIKELSNSIHLLQSQRRKSHFMVGVLYDYFYIKQEVPHSKFHNLYLDMNVDYSLSEYLDIKLTTQYGLADYKKNYLIDGGIKATFPFINIQTGLRFTRTNPTLIQSSLYFNHEIFRSNIWLKPKSRQYYLTIDIKDLNTKISLKHFTIDNLIYFDTLVMPRQFNDLYKTTTVVFYNNLKIRSLVFENTIMIQFINENVFGLPKYWSKHHLSTRFALFKKRLLAESGLVWTITANHKGRKYSPHIGVFHISSEKIPYYPMLDVYFSGKIGNLSFFVRAENIYQYWQSRRVDMRIANYPIQDRRIRLGIEWRFRG